MKKNKQGHVCPVAIAGGLDCRWRRWFQNPRKILAPYVKEGMMAIDIGCGPGFFSIDMARLVGPSGRVIAVDLQKEMLEWLQKKIEGTELEDRFTLHQCKADRIGLDENQKVDFILAFYMVHETPNQEAFFGEVATLLKPNGRLLVVEPPFHVSKAAFNGTLMRAQAFGLTVMETPRVFFGKTALLGKC
ncbi:MAG: class I SAM-dependent methyltransferase [Planctomycetia bacterium]